MTEPQPPPSRNGKIINAINAARGLTPMNALVIFLLSLTLVPGYVIYKLVNEPPLLDRILSGFRELPSPNPDCIVRNAFQRGGPVVWAVATSFAAQGSDRYFFSVNVNHEPTVAEMGSYCETLLLLVDYMQDPAARSPNFPGTDTPIVDQYENGNIYDKKLGNPYPESGFGPR